MPTFKTPEEILELQREGWDFHEQGSNHNDCPHCEVSYPVEAGHWSDGWMMGWMGRSRP